HARTSGGPRGAPARWPRSSSVAGRASWSPPGEKSTATASWHTDQRTTAGSRRGPAPSRRGGGGQRAGPAGENMCTLGGSPRTARAEGRAPCRCPSVFARGVGTCARRVRVYRISRSPDAPSARIVPDTIASTPNAVVLDTPPSAVIRELGQGPQRAREQVIGLDKAEKTLIKTVE